MSASAAARLPGRRRWSAGQRRELLWALVFLAPWLVGFLVFTGGPMLASLVLSFMEYQPFRETVTYVGLQNYENILGDRYARLSFTNTVTIAMMYVPGVVILGLGLASLLNRVGRAVGFFRTVFYLPEMTPAVAVGALFLLLLNGHNGIVNRALSVFGIQGPSWVTDPNWVKPAITLMLLWSIGGTIVILYAALRNVPREMYEAAKIDGAGAWQSFRNITLPFISGPLLFVIVINTMASLNLFAEIWAMLQFGKGQIGGPQEAGLVYGIHLFQMAFRDFRFGYASALAWVLFVIVFVITVIQLALSRRWVYYEGE